MRLVSFCKVSVFIILMLIVFITERLYNRLLFNYSLEIIPRLMSNTPMFLKYYLMAISYLCSKYILLPLIILIYSFCCLKTSIIMSTLLFSSFHIVNILKMVYADPRPFMVSELITPKHCYGDFGNPSGETVYGFSFYLYMFHLLYKEYLKEKQIYLRVIFWLCIMIILFSIPISRTIEGIHSFNQILYGIMIGLTIFFLFFLFIDSNESEDLNFYSNFKKGKWFPFFLIITFIGCLFNSIIHYSIYSTNKIPFDSRLRLICPNLKVYSMFYVKCFGLSLTISGNLAIILGLLVTMETFKLREDDVLVNKYEVLNNWNKTSFKHGIYRYIISLSIAFLFSLPFIVCKNRLNAILYVILNYGGISFIASFILFGVMINLFRKIGLTTDELIKVDKGFDVEKDEKECLVCCY